MIRAFLTLLLMTDFLHQPETARTLAPANPPMMHAAGTFEVKITPTGHAPDPTLASNSLEKHYYGDLEAIAKGEMLSAGDPATGNGGYVAIERVTGKLAGKTGTFAVMQFGIMASGSSPQITVTIIPGSGTGALSGIYGTMTIIVAKGKHSYTVDYSFGHEP